MNRAVNFQISYTRTLYYFPFENARQTTMFSGSIFGINETGFRYMIVNFRARSPVIERQFHGWKDTLSHAIHQTDVLHGGKL